MRKIAFWLFLALALILGVFSIFWGFNRIREWYRFIPILLPAIIFFLTAAFRIKTNQKIPANLYMT